MLAIKGESMVLARVVPLVLKSVLATDLKLTGMAYILVHAKDDAVASFYKRLGFQSFPKEALTLFLSVASLVTAI
jgi:hypothetical protein